MGHLSGDLIKTKQQIDIMREAGKILGTALEEIKNMLKPGIRTWDLEEKFIELCKKNDVIPTCKGYTSYGYPPFPTGLCVSVNSQAPHCFPSKDYIVKDDDIVTVDTVIMQNGLNVDAAFCKAMSKAPEYKKKMVNTTERALYEAINKVRDGVKVGQLANKMYSTIKKDNFDVLRDYAGHGIGAEMHDWPEIPCYGDKNEGPKLKEGMTICIEVLTCRGKPDVTSSSKSWETKMTDGKEFCQMEHTILVTKKGYEILTLPA